MDTVLLLQNAITVFSFCNRRGQNTSGAGWGGGMMDDLLKFSLRFIFLRKGFFFQDAELYSCLPDLFQMAVNTLVERSLCAIEKQL